MGNTFGGSEAVKGSYPSIGRTIGTDSCFNALLIHDDVMIASASCVRYYFKQRIYIGGIERDGSDADDSRIVKFEYPHPDFDGENLLNDIMLLKLDSRSTQPIIAYNRNMSLPQIGSIAKSIHFTINDRLADPQIYTLKELNMTVTTCSAAPVLTSNSIHLCADEIPAGTGCESTLESNPLILDNVLFGLALFDNCESAPEPVVYTRISGVSSWIESTICAISDFPPASCASLPAPSSAPSLDSSKRSASVKYTYSAAITPASPVSIPDSFLNISIIATNACDAVENVQVQLTVANTKIQFLQAAIQNPNGIPNRLFSSDDIVDRKSASLPDGTTIVIDDLAEFPFDETLLRKCATGTCPKKITFASNTRRLNSYIGDFYPSSSTWSLLIDGSGGLEELLSARIVLTCQPFASAAPSSRPSSIPSIKPSIQKQNCGLLRANILCPRTFCGKIGRALGLCDQSCSIIDRILGKCN